MAERADQPKWQPHLEALTTSLTKNRGNPGYKDQIWSLIAHDLSVILYRVNPSEIGHLADSGLALLQDTNAADANLLKRATGAYTLMKAQGYQLQAGGLPLMRACLDHTAVEFLKEEPSFNAGNEDQKAARVMWQDVVTHSSLSDTHDRFQVRVCSPLEGITEHSQELFGALDILNAWEGHISRERFEIDMASQSDIRALVRVLDEEAIIAPRVLQQRLGIADGKTWEDLVDRARDASLISYFEAREKPDGPVIIYIGFLPDGLNILQRAKTLYPEEFPRPEKQKV